VSGPTGTPPPPPPPPRRSPAGSPDRLFATLFAVKGVLTVLSALAVLAVLPWTLGALRDASDRADAPLPAWIAAILARPWIVALAALPAVVSGAFLVFSPRHRILHLVVSSLSLVAVAAFLAAAVVILVRATLAGLP